MRVDINYRFWLEFRLTSFRNECATTYVVEQGLEVLGELVEVGAGQRLIT